ncbi:hypothetical protein TNCV_2184561 [Trichonephila clavipes]|nr:hypothetical protein TNCV_2184561 [Trichonephila clavipes]
MYVQVHRHHQLKSLDDTRQIFRAACRALVYLSEKMLGVFDDGSSSLVKTFLAHLSLSLSNYTALLPNTPIDVRENEDRDPSFDNKRICFSCGRYRKQIKGKLDRFFKALIGGKDIRRRGGVNCHRLSNSLASDAI